MTSGGEIIPSRAVLTGDAPSWVLEEARNYRVYSPDGPIESARLDLLDLRRIDADTVELPIGQWTSASRELRAVVRGDEIAGSVRVVPRTEKLDDETWLRLVADLEAWLPGLTVGASGGTSGGLQLEGIDAPGFAAAALLPLVPGLISALRAVAAAPREETHEYEEAVPLRAVRRADGAALSWLARHPVAGSAVDAWLSLESGAAEPSIPQILTEEALDHPVNRYVAWAVIRAQRSLERLADRLGAAAARAGVSDDDRDWCVARSRASRIAAQELGAARSRTFLRHVEPSPPSQAAILALHDDPLYSRFHRLARPFLNPRYSKDSDREDTPARPTFELYELWTFLAITRALGDRLADWRGTWTLGSSAAHAGLANGAFVSFVRGPSEMRVHFNRTFRSVFAAPDGAPHSISAERRPDIVIEFRDGAGSRSWLFLDAKYRVSRSALCEGFESVHIYRDSLRWPDNGGVCRSGYLLVPAMLDETAIWFSDDYRADHRCGCFVLRPGTAPPSDLVSTIMDELL